MASKINVMGTFSQTAGATTAKTVTVADMGTVDAVVFRAIGTLYGGGYMLGKSNNRVNPATHQTAYKATAAAAKTNDLSNSIHIVPESGKEIIGKVATFGTGTFAVTFSKNDSVAVDGVIEWAARGVPV